MGLETEFYPGVFLISEVRRDHDFPNPKWNLELWILAYSKRKLESVAPSSEP